MTMSERKITINFHNSGTAKEFAKKARSVKGVTYATDYCRTTGSYLVMVCGDWDEETEKKLKRKKI